MVEATTAPGTAVIPPNPFRVALKASFDSLHPCLKRFYRDGWPPRRFQGVMRRIWRPLKGLRGRTITLVLHLCAMVDTLFPETGEGVAFDVFYRLLPSADGPG